MRVIDKEDRAAHRRMSKIIRKDKTVKDQKTVSSEVMDQKEPTFNGGFGT